MRLPGLSMRSIVIDMSCSGWWYEVVGSSGNISTGIQLLQESVIRHVHLLRPGETHSQREGTSHDVGDGLEILHRVAST